MWPESTASSAMRIRFAPAAMASFILSGIGIWGMAEGLRRSVIVSILLSIIMSASHMGRGRWPTMRDSIPALAFVEGRCRRMEVSTGVGCMWRCSLSAT